MPDGAKVLLVVGTVAALFGAIMLIPNKPGGGFRPTQGEVLAPWPLTVPWVRLSCEPGEYLGVRRVFATTPDGTRYAVNGSARSIAPLTTPIEADPDTAALITRGLALCDSHSESIIVRKG